MVAPAPGARSTPPPPEPSTRSPPTTELATVGCGLDRAPGASGPTPPRRSAARPACPDSRGSPTAHRGLVGGLRSRSVSDGDRRRCAMNDQAAQGGAPLPGRAHGGEGTMPRTARSRSADGATMAALLPPSSSKRRGEPLRRRRRDGARPMAVEPVADTSCARDRIGRPGPRRPHASPTRHVADAGRRIAEARAAARSNSAVHASAVNGVFSDGFHTTASPQTSASDGVPGPHRDWEVERRDDSDDAERMPLSPSFDGSGRSLAMVWPKSCRDSPTP